MFPVNSVTYVPGCSISWQASIRRDSRVTDRFDELITGFRVLFLTANLRAARAAATVSSARQDPVHLLEHPRSDLFIAHHLTPVPEEKEF